MLTHWQQTYHDPEHQQPLNSANGNCRLGWWHCRSANIGPWAAWTRCSTRYQQTRSPTVCLGPKPFLGGQTVAQTTFSHACHEATRQPCGLTSSQHDINATIAK